MGLPVYFKQLFQVITYYTLTYVMISTYTVMTCLVVFAECEISWQLQHETG